MFIQFLKYGTLFCGVEHTINNNGEDIFNVLVLKKRKKELNILETKQFTDTTTLFAFLETIKHVFLIVNNNQILSKKSSFVNTNDNKDQLVKNTFNNINLSDFYYQVDNSNTNNFIAICRRNYVDELINTYTKNNIHVIGFSLGNISTQNLLSFISSETLYTSNAKISIEKDAFSEIESDFEKTNYTINDLSVTNNDVVSLSGILLGYFQNGNSTTNFYQKSDELTKTFYNARIFKLGLQGGLGILLTILLANFLFFSNYRAKINSLNTDLSVHETQKLRVNTLKSKVLTKEKLIEDLNNVLQSEISRFIDEIAATVPENILLNELNYQPLQSTIRPDKEMLFNKGFILVRGITKKDAVFSEWTESLTQKEWIKEIVINDFSAAKNKRSSFEFLIALKNDQ